MDLSTLIRYSPTALHLLGGGSPTSSGSYGHLSPGAISPALVHSAHLQQLQAHLIRSASTSPFLSPQNSLQASLLHSSAAAAAAVSAAQAALNPNATTPYFPFINPGHGCDPKSDPKFDPKENSGMLKQPEQCSNVVSSTMEDDDSSSREGLTPLTTVKVRNFKDTFSKSRGRLRATILKSADTTHLIASPTVSADLKMVACNHLLSKSIFMSIFV